MRAILAILTAAAIGVAIWAVPSMAQTTFPNPVTTVTTLTTAAAQVIAQNPTRRSIRLCNAGATAIWIWSGSLAPAKSGELLPPVTANVTACMTPPAGLVGSNGAQWNAIINSGSAGTVSVEEW